MDPIEGQTRVNPDTGVTETYSPEGQWVSVGGQDQTILQWKKTQ